MGSLYELSNSYIQLLELEEGMDSDVFEDTLQSIDESIELKAVNIAKFVRNLEAECNCIEDEKKRLESKISANKNKIDRLKKYLKDSMDYTGKTKINDPLFKITIEKNPPKVNVLNEETIPSEFFTEKTTRSLNKKEVLDKLKQGEQIEGVQMVQETGLRIK